VRPRYQLRPAWAGLYVTSACDCDHNRRYRMRWYIKNVSVSQTPCLRKISPGEMWTRAYPRCISPAAIGAPVSVIEKMGCGEREQGKKHIRARYDRILKRNEIGEGGKNANDSWKRAVLNEEPAPGNRAEASNPTNGLIRKMKPVVCHPEDRRLQWRHPFVRQLMKHEITVAQVATQ
jgi:hypothetical protein